MWKRLSFKWLFIIAAILISAFVFYHPDKLTIRGSGDSAGYYMYLPAIFIHNDIRTLDTCNKIRRQYSNMGDVQTPKLKNGYHLNQYTYGVALLNLPAFIIAHIFCQLTDYPADGYAAPYVLLINLSGLVYIWLGFWFLWKLLRAYFNRSAVGWTMVLLALGTNLYFTAVLQPTMAHGFLFCLVAILFWYSHQLKEKKTTAYFFRIAFLLGLITLIRPTVIIVGLVPVFFAFNSLWQHCKSWSKLLIAIGVFFLPVIPQLIYWKITTGAYVTYSYGEQQFDFLHPHIFEGLLGFKNGWLTYSPLMLFAVIGLIYGTFKKHALIPGILVLTSLHVYIIYSWWCWYYINGFGSRAMIDIYPILAISIAWLLERLSKYALLSRVIYLVIGMGIILNIFQTHQYALKVLSSSEGNFAYYLATFGKTKLDYNALVALDSDILQPENLKLKAIITEENYDDESVETADSTISYSGAYSFCIQPGREYSKGIRTTLEAVEFESSDWLRISAQGLSKAFGTFHENSHLVISVDRGSESLLWRSIRINNKIRETYFSIHNGEINTWKEVYFFVPLRKLNLKSTDQISIYGWNASPIPVCLDNLKLELWGQ